MITVYASTSPNVHKVEIMLHETGLAHEIELVDVHRGAQFQAEFEALSPNRKVPVIVDHDGPGGTPFPVFESGAILIYLAEKTGTFLPVSPGPRSDVMQWLMLQMSAVGPMFGQFNHFRRYAQNDHYGLARYTTQTRRLYDVLEKRLSEQRYLGGDDYSIADIATFPWIRVEDKLFGAAHPVMRTDWPGHPHLTRWYEEIMARPRVRAAVDAFSSRASNAESASPRELDLYYGRGEFRLSLDA